MKKIIQTLLFVLLGIASFAQSWMNNVNAPNPTLGEVKNAFYKYWDGRTPEKGQGYNGFKRWEWFWEQRLRDTDTFPNPYLLWNEWSKYKQTHAGTANRGTTANWTFEGPFNTDGFYNGLGRVNCIATLPNDSNILIIGTPGGGLWKTTDGGANWTTFYDQVASLGVSDIVINPTNPNMMYVATGDADGSNVYSMGVMKTTDGGISWLPTGLTFNLSGLSRISRLLMHPNNPDTLLAASSSGIRLTENGGATWTTTQSGADFRDMEFKPGDPSIVYASTNGGRIFRSINGGKNWSSVLNNNAAIRVAIAVSPADPNIVMAVGSNSLGGLYAIWRSVNSGATFSQIFTAGTNTNLLGLSAAGTSVGGQANYDLAFNMNPANANEVWLGGINYWHSTDGGVSWSNKTSWAGGFSNPNNMPLTHADKHWLSFHPAFPNIMYDCNDGGFYQSSDGGLSWRDLSNGLGISQLYRLGVSQSADNHVLAGLQDNGNKYNQQGTWSSLQGGDGMECAFDNANSGIFYVSNQNGSFYKTVTNGQSWTSVANNYGTGVNARGPWNTPLAMHPTDNNTLLIGKAELFQSTNGGTTWTQISNVSSFSINHIKYAPSNPNIILTARGNYLYKTSNGGGTWSNVRTASNDISGIAVSNSDENKFWITVKGYTNGSSVFQTVNGGTVFTNVTGSLPNVPVNCIVYENGSNDGVYIGTDVGVFYRDGSMTDWVAFDQGLPNAVITELEISQSFGKLWASTFGRGMWSTALYSVLPINLSSFSVSKEGKYSLISWKAPETSGTKSFTIERNINGNNWVAIGTVQPSATVGSDQYKHYDKNPYNGINYYRLHTKDLQGKSYYSAIKTIMFDNTEIRGIDISPNPANGIVTINFSGTDEITNIQVINLEGKLKLNKHYVAGNQFILNVSGWTPGMYSVNITTAKKRFGANLLVK